ncbi:hypothetical protein QYF36_018784 [Acer negundo]|nr:hypothetical protein QYF36_018784 [Acer negundo]
MFQCSMMSLNHPHYPKITQLHLHHPKLSLIFSLPKEQISDFKNHLHHPKTTHSTAVTPSHCRRASSTKETPSSQYIIRNGDVVRYPPRRSQQKPPCLQLSDRFALRSRSAYLATVTRSRGGHDSCRSRSLLRPERSVTAASSFCNRIARVVVLQQLCFHVSSSFASMYPPSISDGCSSSFKEKRD